MILVDAETFHMRIKDTFDASVNRNMLIIFIHPSGIPLGINLYLRTYFYFHFRTAPTSLLRLRFYLFKIYSPVSSRLGTRPNFPRNGIPMNAGRSDYSFFFSIFPRHCDGSWLPRAAVDVVGVWREQKF